MKLVPTNPKSILQASRIIQKGGLVAFPTETVYGLGANALDPIAAAKIFEAKKRPFFDPLILHLADQNHLNQFAETHQDAQKLIDTFWPGPLTVVLKRKKGVPDIVCSGLTTAAFRMPNHPVALELIRKAHCPIAAPSANVFNYLSPTTAQHVLKGLGEDVDLILDGGPCEQGIESTIIGWNEKGPVLLRPGAISLEEIESKIGPIQQENNSSNISAPGQLPYHYSPKTFLQFWNDKTQILSGNKLGFLSFKGWVPDKDLFFRIETLSPSGDLREAATRLFSCLHQLDESSLDAIYVEPVPSHGLGMAIMNRLEKASRRFNL